MRTSPPWVIGSLLAMALIGCAREICIQRGGESAVTSLDGSSGVQGAAGQTDAAAVDEASVGTETGGAAQAAGLLPPQLPSRMLIGLEDNDGTWMGASGVNWDVRWAYFTGSSGNGWYNGWADGTPSGAWARSWLESVVSQRFIPGIQYFLLEGDYGPSGTPEGLLDKKLSSPSVMSDYFTKAKLLFQVAGQIGTPVILVLEGGALEAIEAQSDNDPTRYAAIADSGLPELQHLPNTVAGFGLAFLALRQSVGASNVVMGPNVEPSSNLGDPLGLAATDDLEPHVANQYGFFRPLGVGPNSTGQVFDFLATCPAWADADQSAAQGDRLRWWDAADTASLSAPSFNRYADWLSRFNQVAKARWLLWQVPMGNSNSPNVYNRDGAWAGPYPVGYVLPPGCTEGSKTGCPGG